MIGRTKTASGSLEKAMTNPTVILTTSAIRRQAANWCCMAPENTVVVFKKPGRTIPQNDRMWAMLTDVARQVAHNGKKYNPAQWKGLFMSACGHEMDCIEGLNGEPFYTTFQSSRLSKEEMSDLMEFIASWGAERGVKFTEPEAS